MKKLVRVNPYSNTEVKKLRMEIEKAPILPYYERKWLLEQVDELGW